MRTAALRCVCRRCAGGVTFLNVVDYLDAHRDADVLESEVEASMARHPSGIPTAGVATFPDGSQVLISHGAAATRPNRWATWGPPVELEEDA